jgi:copper chaperone
MESITLKVKGMTCGGCVAAVTRVLQALDGVKEADVSLEQGAARVDYEPARLKRDDLEAAIEDAGYEVVR